jgi:hypothetical protein
MNRNPAWNSIQFDAGSRLRASTEARAAESADSHSFQEIVMNLVRFIAAALTYFGCIGALAADASADRAVSLQSLLEEMVDREAIARFPSPAYTCRQFSSYDRDANDPNDRSTWFANWDRSQFVRIEDKDGRKEYVMMDADGPGAVVRIWSTWHGPGGGEFSNGTLRVYLDGAETPAIEGPIAEIIDGGKLAGPPLSQGVSPKTEYRQRGHNLYLPIPYARHCKITYSTDVPVDRGAKQGEALYYQINYRTYEPSTEVESFSMARLAAAKPVLDAVQKQLRDGGHDESNAWRSVALEMESELPPGGQRQIHQFVGPAAIRQLRFKIDAQDLSQALRSTVLQVDFDGQRTIWAPLGDFFGTGYHIRPYRTWYTEVTDDGELRCAWVMPFEKSAAFSVHNVGEQPVSVEICEAQLSDWSWDDRSMHFHSTWRQLSKVDTGGNRGMEGRNARDVNYVTVEGRGVYAGDSLTIFSGAAKWWGEGDEKIFVDGEDFPSHFGTGTEDYYGYAWCRPEFFDAPFHAQPEGGGNLAGGFSVNSRYRTLDAIPFKDSIRFDMELWHWANTKVDYAPTTFFYATPGATANVQPDPRIAARPVTLKRSDIVDTFHVPGVLEGEDLTIAEMTGGTAIVQDIAAFGWSGDKQIWWIDAHVGDELTIEFPVEKAGRYQLVANLTKANDYAIVEVSVDDEPVEKNFDRYHPTVSHDPIALGEFELREGTNRLTFRIEGANPAALKKYFVGLDYLKLTPVR